MFRKPDVWSKFEPEIPKPEVNRRLRFFSGKRRRLLFLTLWFFRAGRKVQQMIITLQRKARKWVGHQTNFKTALPPEKKFWGNSNRTQDLFITGHLGRGGGLVVSNHAFYSNVPSSNPVGYLYFLYKKTKFLQKRDRGWPPHKYLKKPRVISSAQLRDQHYGPNPVELTLCPGDNFFLRHSVWIPHSISQTR